MKDGWRFPTPLNQSPFIPAKAGIQGGELGQDWVPASAGANGIQTQIVLIQDGSMSTSAAEIMREYGPFPGVDHVHGLTFDGQHVWFASGDRLNAFDPANGKMVRSLDVAGHAGTAFDGQHLFQLAEDRIQKIDPKTG